MAGDLPDANKEGREDQKDSYRGAAEGDHFAPQRDFGAGVPQFGDKEDPLHQQVGCRP